MNSDPTPSAGTSALISTAVAMLGVLVALHPHNAMLAALTSAMPQLRDALTQALPLVLTAFGAIGAAVSHPPARIRAAAARVVNRVKAWLATPGA
jgi:hypothetical protein